MTYRPLQGRLSRPATGGRRVSLRRKAPAVIVGCAAGLLSAIPAFADPSIASKQAQAQQVLVQVQQLDSSLERAIEAYNLANEKLNRIKHDLRVNRQELRVARANLGRAQKRLSERVRTLYTSGVESSTLEVVLGATSLDDLLNRLDTASRVSEQDTRILREVYVFRAEVQRREKALEHAHAAQAQLVAERAARRGSIERQLAQRRSLLSSIRGQIAQLQEQERARQAQLRRQLQARISLQQQQSTSSALTGGLTAPSSAAGPAPPATHGGVVAIAMQYLGTPYVWGGASPSGFDCSGLVMYAFAQVGVSLPHNAAAQYGYGSAVSRSELQPGDVVFFNGLGHNGIYVGGNSFIHAPHSGDVVKISSMTGWYDSTFVGARRM